MKAELRKELPVLLDHKKHSPNAKMTITNDYYLFAYLYHGSKGILECHSLGRRTPQSPTTTHTFKSYRDCPIEILTHISVKSSLSNNISKESDEEEVKKSKTFPKSKKTWNRDEKLVDDSWIVNNSDLLKYEKIAMDIKNIKDRPKQFLVNLYSNQGYISFFKKKKRGSNAKNWRYINKEDYICPSLHKANNIYQALGKASSLEAGVPNSWINTPIIETQCITITKKGKQCCKTKCETSNMCTQHYKLYKNK